MRSSRTLLTAGAVIAVLAIAVIIGFQLDQHQQSAVPPSDSRPSTTSLPNAAQPAGLLDDRFGLLIQIGGGFAVRSESGSSLGQFEGYAPVVSPDGRQVAYWRDSGGRSELRLVDPARPSEPRTLVTLPTTERGGGGILWSADGTALVLPIYSVATFDGIDGGPKTAVLRTLTLNGGAPREVWKVTNGRVLTPVAWERAANTIGAIETGPGGFVNAYDVVVTDANSALMGTTEEVHGRVVGVQGSSDGTRVLGIWMDENTVHIWPTRNFSQAYPVGKGGTLYSARWRPGPSGQVWWSVNNDVGWFIPQTSSSAVMYGGSSPLVVGPFRPDGSAVVLAASGVGRRSTVLVDATTIRTPVEIGSDSVVGTVVLR